MSFEERFFGPGNKLRWPAIQGGLLPPSSSESLRPFLQDLGRDVDTLTLPRVREEDGRVQWYVLSSSSRAARIARDEFRAMLGPSYSDFEGQPTNLSANDEIDKAVLERYPGRAFRIEVPNPDLFAMARERLGLWQQLRDERPGRNARLVRPIGRVLRDFEYALQIGGGEAAARCIDELRANGRLDALNLLFLDVRRLASLREWSAIRALPEFDALVAMVRPRRVTACLIETLYETQLRVFEAESQALEAVETFRRDIYPHYRALYSTKAGLSGFEVDVSFLMAAVVAEPPRLETVRETLAAGEHGPAQRAFLDSIAALVSPRQPHARDAMSEAREAFLGADIDRAFAFAALAPVSVERSALLLRCARDMRTLAAASVALAAVNELPEPQLIQLRERAILVHIYEELGELGAHTEVGNDLRRVEGDSLPTSWPEWLRRLSEHPRWPGALSVAENGSREWSLDVFLDDPKAIQETAELVLEERPAWGREVLRDATPFLLEFVLTEAPPDPRLRSIYENLFLMIAVDEQVTLPQATALMRLAEACLQLGATPSTYKEIVDQIATAFERIGSPSAAHVALEAADMLVQVACPSLMDRQAFMARVAALFQRWYRRIDTAQWTLLTQLGEELGIQGLGSGRPTDGEEVAEASAWTRLNGKTVALYSLRESVLRRSEAVLKIVAPTARVEVFHDKVGGSAALRAAAATADLFVVATAAAKHAATLFIEAKRPATKTTAYARGQGSASMLEAARESLSKL